LPIFFAGDLSQDLMEALAYALELKCLCAGHRVNRIYAQGKDPFFKHPI
jgi:hypothetical protein